MDEKEIVGGKFEIDISQLQKGLNQANRLINLSNSEFKSATAGMDKWQDSVDGVNAKIKNLNDITELQRKKVNALQAEYDRLIKEGTNPLNRDMVNLQTRINKETATLKENEAQLEKCTNSLKEMSGENQKIITASEKLRLEISKQEEELKGLRNQYSDVVLTQGKSSDEARELASQMNDLNKKLKDNKTTLYAVESASEDYVDALENANNESNNLNNQTQKLKDGFTTLKGVMANLIADGIKKMATELFNLGKEVITTGSSFESAFAGVKKTVNATDEEIAKLRKDIIDMSTEMPATADEIAAVAEAAGQLGIKTEDISAFTKVMIGLGESTNLSATDAASALAKFANITGMSAKDYDKLGSVIVALGNNFATTEADIVEMATRLAATGELSGLTESQIMALATSMSSVGIEAEAGGSAMSKLLKTIQVAVETGSKDMDSFAKVAGMTSGEFKKAFEKDAVSALSAFIGGLNDTERNGKSAIVILEEMGLTEIRLSNTVLSLANANGVMNDAVKLANDAWNENVALTNEVEQRYKTTESKFDKMKNTISALAIRFYDKLQPAIQKFIDAITKIGKDKKFEAKLDNFTDKLGNFIKEIANGATKAIPKFVDLLEDFMDNFNKIKATIVGVTAAFVTYKVAMAAGNVAITAYNALSKIHQAQLLLQQGATVKATAAQLGLNTAMSLNPVGLVVTAIAALTAGLIAFAASSEKAKKAESEETIKLREQKEAIDEMRTALEEENEARKERLSLQQETADAGISEMTYYQNLWNELKNITDANGKVKDGYKDRANFIINELNKALGLEISLNDGIVKGYKEIQAEIDKVIAKKKAQIILDSKAENYENAVKELENYKKTNAEYKIKYENIQKEYNEKKKMLDLQADIVEKAKEEHHYDAMNPEKIANLANAQKKYQELRDTIYGENGLLENLNGASENYTSSKEQLAQAYKDIAEYEGMSAQILAGNYEAVVNDYNSRIIDMTDTTAQALYTNTGMLVDSQNQLKELILTTTDETQKGILESYLKGNTEQLNALMTNLTQQQLTIGQASPEIIGAWKNIAENSTSEYETYLKGLDPATRERIQSLVALTNSDGTLNIRAWASLAAQSKDEYNKALSSVDDDTRKEIEAAVAEVESKEAELETASRVLGQAGVKGVREELEKFKEAGEEGTKSYSEGLYRDKAVDSVVKNSNKLASKTSSTLKSEDNLAKATNSGSQVGQGFGIGINSYDARQKVISNATKLANLANSTFKSVEDIHSPSRVTKEFGKFWTLGIAEGIEAEENSVVSKVKSLANTVNSAVQSKISLANNKISASNNSNANNSANNGAKSITVNQTINSPKAVDRKEIYRRTKNVATMIATANG